MLTALPSFIQLFGSYEPNSDEQRNTLLKYKSNYLYTREYKECVNESFHSVYLFDEPLNCLTDNYLQEAFRTEGVQLDDSETPDLVHILKNYSRGDDLNIKTLANKQGQVMFITAYLRLPAGNEIKTLREISKEISESYSFPQEIPDPTTGTIKWSWVTPDGYDIQLKSFKNYGLLTYVNRQAYKVLNKNKIKIY